MTGGNVENLRKRVSMKGMALRKLSGFRMDRQIKKATLKQLIGINGDLDEKISRILNYRRYGHDPIVQGALAKHGVLSIAKLADAQVR